MGFKLCGHKYKALLYILNVLSCITVAKVLKGVVVFISDVCAVKLAVLLFR